ncbi:MAG: hypothetical protein PUP93_32525 [Rhizonema sp. NSF051]|nr:hypothetical protein [Rhizonema sp. NSF051]
MNIAIDTKPLYRKGQLVEVQREDVIYHGVVIKVREVNSDLAPGNFNVNSLTKC